MFSLAAFALSAIVFSVVGAIPMHADVSSGSIMKRAVYNCTDPDKLAAITAGYTEGQALASITTNYIATNGLTDPLFQSYFGADQTLSPYVPWVYSQIANENRSNFTLSCDYDPSGYCHPGSDTIAYTSWVTTICIKGSVRTPCAWKAGTRFCPLYYGLTATADLCTSNSSGSKGSNLVHEMSHALGHTHDKTSSCSSAKALATSNPADAVINAKAYGCFAVDVYRATQCGV